MTSTTTKGNPLGKKLGTTVTPGDRLGNILALRNKGTQIIAGEGTYVHHGHLFASITGQVMASSSTVSEQQDDDHLDDNNTNDDNNNKWIVSIQQTHQQQPQSAYAKSSTGICPVVGSLILGRVTRVVRPSYANVDIIAIVPSSDNNNQQQQQQQQHQQTKQPYIIPFHEPFTGTLRQNEIKPQSAIELEISDCVRPGDVILARIHALGGGEKDYILSTAETELGVVKATCESSGYELQPISYKEMECPVTKVKEGRKVAKPKA